MIPDNIDMSHVVICSDLHLGMRNNSRQHNEWCVQFVEWMIDQSRQRQIRTCLFLGDWSHNRSSVNVVTLNHSIECLRKLNDYFDHTVMLLGNHDLYFRDRLDLHSIPYVHEFPRIHLVSKPQFVREFAFVPWMVGDEHKQISKITQPYLFCHAEIARFKMNAMIELPDHGGLNAQHFRNQKLVMSGHFHKRQRKDHILYVGNAFPHNFADVNDDQRGCAFWQPGQEPTFAAWPHAPKYRVLNLSEVILDASAVIDHRTFARINVDVNLSYEDQNFIRELLETQLRALDVSMIQPQFNQDLEFSDDDVSFESVDTIVLGHLASIESSSMDRNLLTQIYQSI